MCVYMYTYQYMYISPYNFTYIYIYVIFKFWCGMLCYLRLEIFAHYISVILLSYAGY
jgi:hypothetical protein